MQRLPFLFLAVLAGACAGPPPAVDAAADAGAAVGLPGAVPQRQEAEPIDAALAVPDGGLTVEVAVRLALQHDPAVQASLAEVRQALAEAEGARAFANPLLDLGVRFPSGGGPAQLDLGLTAELVAILQTPARARAADARLQAAGGRAVAAALDTVAAVQASWFRLQALDAGAPWLAARQAAAERLAALARTRVEHGDAAPIEAEEFAALGLQVQVDAAGREQERVAERLRLRALLGAPGGELPLQPTAWAAPPAGVVDEAACIQAALRFRPELAAAAAEVGALGIDLDRAGLAWLGGARLGAVAQREGGWSLGPALELPLPIGDAGGARTRQLAAEQSAAQHRATRLGRDVVVAVRTAVAAVTAADARLARVRDGLLPVQRRRHDLAAAAYQAGDGTAAGVLRAELELHATEELLRQLQRDVWLARVDLERAVGGSRALAAATATPSPPSAPSPTKASPTPREQP